MDADGQLRNLRDFLLVYNRMTEICFQRCTTNFNYRNLTMDEERCVDNCAGKLIRSNHRLMGTYVQLMPAMVQRRMEEMESKAAEAAKAAAAASPAEPLAGSLGTPETTAVGSSATASPSLAAEHVVTVEVPAGSVSFPSSTAESTLSDLSSVPASATSGTAAILLEPVIPSVASQTPNVSLTTERPHTGTAVLPTATSSIQTSSEVALSPDNTSLPAQGSLSSAAAAIPVENLALKVSVDDSSRASAALGLQSTAGTKQDKTS